MGLRETLHRLFGRTEPRSHSSAVGPGPDRPVGRPAPESFDLSRWVENQRATYGARKGLAAELERKASHLRTSPLGLSGSVLDELAHHILERYQESTGVAPEDGFLQSARRLGALYLRKMESSLQPRQRAC